MAQISTEFVPTDGVGNVAAETDDEIQVEDDEFACGSVLAIRWYGPNTPRKKTRSRRIPTGVWASIKRLRSYHPALARGQTHVCTRTGCWKLLRLTRDDKQGLWLTTRAVMHDRQCHSRESASALKSLARTHTAAAAKQAVMFYSSAALPSTSTGRPLPMRMHSGTPVPALAYSVSKRDAALGAQARSYVYGRGRISKESFDDPVMRARDQAMYEAGGGTGTAPFITKQGLAAWVRAEYSIFIVFMKFITKINLEYSEGNRFGQGLQDCVTLASTKKHSAIGLCFIDPKLKTNHAVCLGMVLADTGGKDIAIAAKIREVALKVTGFTYDAIAHSTIVDFAALGVCNALEHEREGCDMHNIDKIAKVACGDLERSRMGVAVNPFPEGQLLMKKAHAAAVYFSYGARHSNLIALGAFIEGGVPNVRIKTDLCKTRVAARRSVIYSMLRLNKALKLYMSNHKPDWALNDEQWEAIAEFEAVMAISVGVSVVVQTETLFMGALGRVLQERMMSKYKRPELDVFDLSKVTEAQSHPRVAKSVASFTPTGAACSVERDSRESGATAATRRRSSPAPTSWCPSERRWPCSSTRARSAARASPPTRAARGAPSSGRSMSTTPSPPLRARRQRLRLSRPPPSS